MSDLDFAPAQPRRLAGAISAALLVVALVVGLGQFNLPGISTALAGDSAPSAASTAGRLVAAQTDPDSIENDQAVEAVADAANPAVVTVTNLQRLSSPFDNIGSELEEVGVGSGFIIDEAGYVVTNNHVIEGAEAIVVTFADGTDIEATALGDDLFQDVALLLLDLSDGETVPGVLAFDDDDDLAPGDTVIAIGTALGEFANTVTIGSVEETGVALDTGLGYELAHLVQHDAELWPGNSGGPLLDLEGEVVGMNVAAAGGSRRSGSAAETGFAIESDAIADLVDQLIVDGAVDRPFLGIEGEPGVVGQRVVEVVVDGPADEAGLRIGDLIVAIDGEEIDSDTPLLNLLFDYAPGDTVALTVDRDGESLTIEIVLGERPTDLS